MSRTYVVAGRDPSAADTNPGTEAEPLKRISRAAALAEPGDTVLVHAGVYRERVAPARGGTEDEPITYRAAPREDVVVRGSEIWNPCWECVDEAKRIYRGSLSGVFAESEINPFAVRAIGLPGHKTLGQVFVDGDIFTEVDGLSDLAKTPRTWCALSDGTEVAIRLSEVYPLPQDCTVEVSVRNRVFAPYQRGLGHIRVYGFTFEHCANQSASGFWIDDASQREASGTQGGAFSCRSGHHWTVEGNTIRHANSIGMDIGSEGARDKDGAPDPETVGYHRIAHNIVSDNGECGICGRLHHGCRIVGNRVERNNALGYWTWEEAGIKLHCCYDGLIEGNLVRDNDCTGIWLDNVWYGTRITRNVVTSNYTSGIFVEMGDGPCLVDHNIVAHTRAGDGVYTHDAAGVVVVHNLLYANAHFGVYMRSVATRNVKGQDGESVVCTTSRQRILNNLFIDNYRGCISLPLDDDTWGRDNRSDYNLLIHGAQWQWEGLGFGRFVVNNSDGRLSAERVYNHVESTLKERGGPSAAQRDWQRWRSDPYLTLEEWRLVTGNDEHSQSPTAEETRFRPVTPDVIDKGKMNFLPRSLSLEFQSGEYLLQFRCPPVPGMDVDFYGTPMPDESVLAGPFQGITTGANRLAIWPAV